MSTLSGLRFVFVTGKGGVGKSTVSAILGAGLAARGRKVLIAADAGANSLGYLLETAVGQDPTEVAKNLFAIRIEPKASMKEYASDAIGSRLLSNAIFNERVALGFLEGVPGLLPWALLGKAWYATTEAKDGPELPGAPYDTVVFDGFSTGDGTELLRLPETLMRIAPPGKLRRDAEKCYQLLTDPERSRVVPVTLPAALPVRETEELVEQIRTDLRYPLGPLVLNQVRREFLDQEERNALLRRGGPSRPLLKWLEERASLEESGQEARTTLKNLGLPVALLPATFPPPRGISALAELAESSNLCEIVLQ
jgi:anion-transporting  ArsA/GET3 family ATPase